MSQSNAPVSQAGELIKRTGDLELTLEVGGSYFGNPTATRTYQMPSYDSVPQGSVILVRNLSGGQDIQLQPAPGEKWNDGPVDTALVVSPGATVRAISLQSVSNASVSLAGSWFSTT